MRIAILSPHRDDAAFSCGLNMFALLQAGAEFTVINVFTRSDYAVDLQTVPPALPRVDAVSQARRLEDERFVADIASFAGREPEAVRLHDLHWLDAPLRLTVETEQVLQAPITDAEVHAQATELAAQLLSLRSFDLVFAPLALGDHIDHRVAREAVKLCTTVDRLCLYEDLPYAAWLSLDGKDPPFEGISSGQHQEFVRYALHLPHGPHLKRRFAKHYPSQISVEVADEMASYAAQWGCGITGVERWWATPPAGTRILELLRTASVACSVVEEQQ